MLLRPSRHNAKTAPCASTHPPSTYSVDDGGVDFLLAPVAIDRRARGTGDDCAAAALERPPDEAVDEGVFKSCKGRLSAGGQAY